MFLSRFNYKRKYLFNCIVFCLFMLFIIIHNSKDSKYNISLKYIDDIWDELNDPKIERFRNKHKVNKPTILDDNYTIPFDFKSFKEIVEQPTTHCRHLLTFGGTWDCRHCSPCSRDGHKYVCMDKDVAPIPGDCLVYSFGIGDDIAFDTKMFEFNCKIIGFDMTLVGAKPRKLLNKIHFIPNGLNNEDMNVNLNMHSEDEPDKYTPITTSFKKLETIRKILDHEDIVIDILKMDIEFNEWKVFEQIFSTSETEKALKGVKQIALEIHFDDFKNKSSTERVKGAVRYKTVLDGLKSRNFHLVHTELNSFAQVFSEIRGDVTPLFRESLFIWRP